LALSQRGKLVAGIGAAIAVLIVGIGAWALATGKDPVEAVRDAAGALPGVPDPEPPKCPLTGEDAPGGVIPDRPVAAVKVENTDDARPQAGLERADIVYEELVEGGITRFIAMYHCDDAPHVGPVRSARTTDPDVLLQYGRPILAYSGGTSRVQKLVARSGVFDFNEDTGGEAFERDAGRAEPHNLFVNTTKLRNVAGKKADRQDAPEPPFTYGEWEGKSKKATGLTMTFSMLNTVGWEWSRREDAWLRIDNGTPNVLENGDRLSTQNIIVQFVKVSEGDIQDVTGSPSPEVTLTGGGKAYLFRDGRVIAAKWERDSLEDVTTFEAKDGEPMALDPGQTWVELYPAKGDFADATIDFGR
jgi:hypothetical protein